MTPHINMPYHEVVAVLARLGFDRWLEVHGKMDRKDLTKKQEMELKECYELIDARHIGNISVNDMPFAFDALGMDVTKDEVDEAVRQICGEKKTMAFSRFKNVILHYYDKLPIEDYAPNSDNGIKQASAKHKVPFAFKAQAYRRKKLREAVATGEKKLYARMKLRSERAFKERKALRELATMGDKKPKGRETPSEPAKRRANAASGKKNTKAKPYLPEYNLIPREVIKEVLATGVKYVPATNTSVETDRPFSGPGGEILSKADLKWKLDRLRSDIRHKPSMWKQLIRAQAVKARADFYKKGAVQVKGSPLLHPATHGLYLN